MTSSSLAAITDLATGGANCVDVANFQGWNLPWGCWKDAGIRRAIVGCQWPDYAAHQIETGVAAGIVITSVYAYLYLGVDWLGQTMSAIDIALGYDVPRVWLDCESLGERAGIQPAERRANVQACIDAVTGAGLEVGIYASPSFWLVQMANWDLGELPYWMADYRFSGLYFNTPAYPDLCWKRAAIHQYTSTGTRNDESTTWDAQTHCYVTPPLCGVSIDYDYDFEPEREPVMSPSEKKINAVAWGDYDIMKVVYARALSQGMIANDGLVGTADDLGTAMQRRARLAGLLSVADTDNVVIQLGL